MKLNLSNRQFLSAAIIVFYLIPLLFFSIYSIKLMSHNKSWSLLSLGLLLVVFGTLSLIFLLLYWEQSIRDKKPLHSLPLHVSHEKEAKVTLLDPSLTFNQKALHEDGEKENTKELHLIQTALTTHQEQHKEFIKALETKSQELDKQ